MKKLFPFLFLFVACGVQQGPLVNSTPAVKVFEVNKSKNDLYVSANNWMAETFNSAKSVIQFTDKEAGIVTGKYRLRPGYSYSNYEMHEVEDGSIYAIIKIQVKDGAARITITPDDFHAFDGSLMAEEYKYTQAHVTRDIRVLEKDFGEYLSNDTSENW